ncbi:LOW QUALITY PROTEIN: outer dynein arm-docking complex subunit 3-like [Oncorhynchus keta]|uniref:LOW QUALITY PROTEIN: outer dynein arm-docking complex subunit 3-like n=1 Tax=Oncorhynchus keta TaxID=8018 RepID=UPI00227C4B47|nr:LOW QUALITY PROTEIN: outer dynein arm-docking complex subunit 3-like [Oncorhynchus keta]
MPFSAEAIKPPLHDQITELQRKIQLLEGDRSAYYEMSQSSIKKNRNSILQLRQENKRLHKKLANALAGDEQVIKEAFQSRGMEKAAFRNMSGKAALKVLDQKVCDKMKKLNALKHTTQTYRRRLEDLQTLYQSMKPENRGPERDTERRSEEAKNLQVLENRLEKAQLKCQEAEHIMRGYLKLKAHLQEESLTFQSQLDKLEAEILRQRQELKDLQVLNSDALLSKDTAKAELQRQEEQVYRERKDRECILTRYKKEAEDRKAQAERVERRAQRAAMQPDELSSDAQRSATGLGEEERAISTFEEAFRRIKEATGVTDTREVVERFISQGDTQQHLEDLKKENQRTLVQLKEDRDRLQEHFQDIKYSGETKLSSGQQMLEDCKRHLQAEQGSRDAAKERLDWLTRTLNTVRAGVEHLSDKLQHIKLGDRLEPQLPPGSEEYVVELLSQSEQKLLLLQEELQGKDLAAVMKEMEEEEFHASIEGKLPHCNTRIKLPEAQRQDPYDEEEESGDDEGDIITRAILKHQSQLIIDSKTKRKTRTKKKKGKL